MPSRAARWALAAACLTFLVPAVSISAPAPQGGTRIGVFSGGHQDAVTFPRALGVRYERLVLAINGGRGNQLARIQAARAAGLKLNVQFNNLAASATSHARSGAIASDAAYESQLATALDASHPDLVTIQNEEDGLGFWSGTPQDYLRELTDAVRVAHAKGYKIGNGGITSEGVKLAYWHHLWTSGQHAAADAFARRSLGPDVGHGHVIVGDIPDSAAPGRPILSASEPMRGKLGRAETLIAGYRATGADYVNFHWYESDAEDMRAVATWLSHATGLPAICNEMGQYSNNADNVRALLTASEAVPLAYVMWFAIDGHGPAVGLADENGALRGNGQAFRAFVTSH